MPNPVTTMPGTSADRDAFVAGLNCSFRLVALLALAGLVVAVLFVGSSLLGRRAAVARSAERSETGS